MLLDAWLRLWFYQRSIERLWNACSRQNVLSACGEAAYTSIWEEERDGVKIASEVGRCRNIIYEDPEILRQVSQ
jgi:hypothetical protein